MYRQGAQTTPMRGQDGHGHGMRLPKAPERPIVPFMRFSKKMWPVVRQENADKPLWDIGKVVNSLWRELSDAERAVYQQEYEAEKAEYEKSMRTYQSSPSYQQQCASSRGRPCKPSASVGGGQRRGGVPSEAANSTGIVIQPVDDEDPYELTAKRLAAIRYERNGRLMTELFTGAYLPDTRSIVPQFRIEQLRKQAHSLTAHQNKLNEELKSLDESFNQRKRKIEESAEHFAAELRRVHDEKPQLGEEKYSAAVAHWEGVLLSGYEAHKRRGDEIRARLEAERAEAPVLYSLTCPTPEAQPDSGENTAAAAHNGDKPQGSDAAEPAVDQ